MLYIYMIAYEKKTNQFQKHKRLRYRQRSIANHGPQKLTSNDSFGEKDSEKSKVRKRWSLVRETFLSQAGRSRSGTISKEWEPDLNDFGGGKLSTAADDGGGSIISDFPNEEDDQYTDVSFTVSQRSLD
jgi:hypothetical protein